MTDNGNFSKEERLGNINNPSTKLAISIKYFIDSEMHFNYCSHHVKFTVGEREIAERNLPWRRFFNKLETFIPES